MDEAFSGADKDDPAIDAETERADRHAATATESLRKMKDAPPASADDIRNNNVGGDVRHGAFGSADRETAAIDVVTGGADRHADAATDSLRKTSDPPPASADDKSGVGNGESNTIEGRLRRRKVALFLGYQGDGYAGMQRNPGMKTIEGALMDAFVATGTVAAQFHEDFGKVQWARAARTDRGVSAAGQVVSAFLNCERNGALDSDLLQELSQMLPDDIKVFGWLRCTGAFNAKNDCIKRRYEYVMPLSALEQGSEKATFGEDAERPTGGGHPAVSRFNTILRKYLGTHYFHNFTDNMDGKSPTAQRYIMQCDCSEPVEVLGRRLVVVTLVGQSFVLHQIRKMVGLALQVLSTDLPLETIDVCLAPSRSVTTPTAPALGLLLVECFYTFYNRRYCKQLKRPIELAPFADIAAAFKRDVLYAAIARKENETQSMDRWISHMVSSLKMDRDRVLSDYNSLQAERDGAVDRRKRQRESFYPVHDQVDDMFVVSGAELESQKRLITEMQSVFKQTYKELPQSFVRVPGVATLLGEYSAIAELPCLTFTMPEACIVAVSYRADARVDAVQMEHPQDLVALKTSGVRTASATAPLTPDWGRCMSLGWQAGVCGRGERQSNLPGARLMFGGQLKLNDHAFGGQAALLLASLLSFMRLFSWLMPKEDVAQMAYGAEQLGGDQSCVDKAAYSTMMTGRSNALSRLSFTPRPSSMPLPLPTWLRLVIVSSSAANADGAPVETLPVEDVVGAAQRIAVQTECQLAASLLAKRCGCEKWDAVRSLRSLCSALQLSVREVLELAKRHLKDTEAVSLEGLAEELELAPDLLRERVGACRNPPDKRLSVAATAYYVLREAERTEAIEKQLANTPSPSEGMALVAKLMNESQAEKECLWPENETIRKAVGACRNSGAVLAARSGGDVHSASSYPNWYIVCVCASDEDVVKLTADVDGSEFRARRVTPSPGASVWAALPPPLLPQQRQKMRRHKKLAKYSK